MFNDRSELIAFLAMMSAIFLTIGLAHFVDQRQHNSLSQEDIARITASVTPSPCLDRAIQDRVEQNLPVSAYLIHSTSYLCNTLDQEAYMEQQLERHLNPN